MKYAIIENGIVANVALAEEPLATNWVECQDAGPGWAYANGVFTPPVAQLPEPARRILTKIEFLRLLTQDERIAFRQAAKVSPVMEDFMHLLDSATEVSKDDPDVIKGLNDGEAAGLLAAGRAAEILS